MDNRLIARYLAGECSGTERQQIKQWITSDPTNREVMSEYKEIWKASEKESGEADLLFDPDKDWQQLRTKINQDRKKTDEQSSSAQYITRTSSNLLSKRFQPFIRVAAILLIASLAGALAYQNLYQKPEPVTPALREISMKKGQRGNITLSDGTKVTLNVDSKIILPEVFQSDKREVTLKGEAFFEVAHNTNRPFIINTDQAVVQVLGTSLDVRSYPDDESVQVVVRDGRVSLSSKKECVDDNAILTKGELGLFKFNENRITSKKVEDLDLFLGWKNGLMKFKDALLGEVATDLERRYDIEVDFDDRQLRDLRLTAALKSRTIRDNMDVIATSLGLAYKMDQQQHKITFYDNNN